MFSYFIIVSSYANSINLINVLCMLVCNSTERHMSVLGFACVLLALLLPGGTTHAWELRAYDACKPTSTTRPKECTTSAMQHVAFRLALFNDNDTMYVNDTSVYAHSTLQPDQYTTLSLRYYLVGGPTTITHRICLYDEICTNSMQPHFTDCDNAYSGAQGLSAQCGLTLTETSASCQYAVASATDTNEPLILRVQIDSRNVLAQNTSSDSTVVSIPLGKSYNELPVCETDSNAVGGLAASIVIAVGVIITLAVCGAFFFGLNRSRHSRYTIV